MLRLGTAAVRAMAGRSSCLFVQQGEALWVGGTLGVLASPWVGCLAPASVVGRRAGLGRLRRGWGSLAGCGGGGVGGRAGRSGRTGRPRRGRGPGSAQL